MVDIINIEKYLTVPIHIDIVLYRYNYIDNLIISELKKSAFVNYLNTSETNKTVFSVLVKEFKQVFYRRFGKELDNISNFIGDSSDKNINSIYFLDMIFEKFENLKVINVNISNDKNFTRLMSVNDTKSVGFDYRVAYGVIDYPRFLSENELYLLNHFFVDANIMPQRDTPFVTINCIDFINRVIEWEESNQDELDEYANILDITYELVQEKLEKDNTVLLIKNDFYD